MTFRLAPASFADSIAAANRRRVVLPAEFYGQLQGVARAQAFTVSRLAQQQQIEQLRASLIGDMQAGGDFEAWRARILSDPQFAALTPRHLETIYRTNLQTHHAAGRARAILANARAFPYLQYSAIRDTRTRPEHLALHGIILPVDHPWWRTHFPPLAFNCRCTTISLTKRQAESRIAAARDEGKPIDRPPAGVFTAEGWAYDRLHGDTSSGIARSVIRRALQSQSTAAIAAQLEAEAQRQARLSAAIDAEATWVVEQGTQAGGSIEFASIIDAQGRVLLRKRGGRSAVTFTTQEVELWPGAVLVHNHPSGRSLSRADLRGAATYELHQIIAVGNTGDVWAARVNVTAKRLAVHTAEAEALVTAELRAIVRRGTLTRVQAEHWREHCINAILAARGLIWYEANLSSVVPLPIRQALLRLTAP